MSELDKVTYEIKAKDTAWPLLPVIMADTDTGEIVYVSPSAAETFGYPPDELVGLQIEVLVPEAIRVQHVGWRKSVAVPRTRLMGVGRQVMGVRKNGTLFPAHVGLTEMTVFERSIGIAFVIDLSGVSVAQAEPTSGQFRVPKSPPVTQASDK